MSIDHKFPFSWVIPDVSPDVCLDKAIAAADELGQSEKMHVNKVNQATIDQFI